MSSDRACSSVESLSALSRGCKDLEKTAQPTYLLFELHFYHGFIIFLNPAAVNFFLMLQPQQPRMGRLYLLRIYDPGRKLCSGMQPGSGHGGNHGWARMGKIIIEILKVGGAMQGLCSARYQCSSTNIRGSDYLILS